jgi:transposase
VHSIASNAIIIGVDTHIDVHVAVAINGLGARIGSTTIPVTADGYRQLAAHVPEPPPFDRTLRHGHGGLGTSLSTG